MGNANAVDASPLDTSPSMESPDLIRLLSQHFGDGVVYLANEGDRQLLATAIEHGLISSDGRVTAAGFKLWRKSNSD